MEAAFTLTVDYGLPRKEVNPGTTFEGGGVSICIPFFIDMGIVYFYFMVEKMCICVYYCKYCIELVYKAPQTIWLFVG